jgi:tetratricopeptide (TPR) repeat protein
VRGIDTYAALSERYAKESNNAEFALKLACKYRDAFNQKDKAIALFRQVRSADPKLTSGLTEVEAFGVRASLREYAEYFLAELEPGQRGAAMRAFVAKYPHSPLLKSAYGFLTRFYYSGVTQDEAGAFFAKYVDLFPGDIDPLAASLRYIVNNGGPAKEGRNIAARMRALAGQDLSSGHAMSLAYFYAETGDPEAAFEVFGRDLLDPRRSPGADLLARCARFWMGQKVHHQDALRMVERALALDPGNPNLRQSAARVYLLAGDKKRALDVYGPGFVTAFRDRPAALAAYAQYWSRQQMNFPSAAEAASRSAEMEPEGRTYDTLALILVLEKRYDEALVAAEKALALARESDTSFGRNRARQYENHVKQIKQAAGKAQTAPRG